MATPRMTSREAMRLAFCLVIEAFKVEPYRVANGEFHRFSKQHANGSPDG
jgi:hypothetical protein